MLLQDSLPDASFSSNGLFFMPSPEKGEKEKKTHKGVCKGKQLKETVISRNFSELNWGISRDIIKMGERIKKEDKVPY